MFKKHTSNANNTCDFYVPKTPKNVTTFDTARYEYNINIIRPIKQWTQEKEIFFKKRIKRDFLSD